MFGMRSLVFVALAACGGGQTPIEVVTVHALRTPCQSFEADLCLTMQPDFELPELLFFEIEGYTHRWGVEAELRIHREQADPAPREPSERIILDEIIIEREPITAPFQLEFPASGAQWFVSRPPNIDMLGTTVLCETTVCSAMLNAQTTFTTFGVTFELTDDPQTLTAISVP